MHKSHPDGKLNFTCQAGASQASLKFRVPLCLYKRKPKQNNEQSLMQEHETGMMELGGLEDALPVVDGSAGEQ